MRVYSALYDGVGPDWNKVTVIGPSGNGARHFSEVWKSKDDFEGCGSENENKSTIEDGCHNSGEEMSKRRYLMSFEHIVKALKWIELDENA